LELPIILVVEDDQLIQSLVEDTLSDGGFDTVVAASGEEALTLLQGHKGKYRALVTDINLPGKINGWEVAQHAREIEPEFPSSTWAGPPPQIGPPKASQTASCWPSHLRQPNF
jgi:CheY-like chemotaxis protein